jgi:hypothetical protein
LSPISRHLLSPSLCLLGQIVTDNPKKLVYSQLTATHRTGIFPIDKILVSAILQLP